MSNNVVDILKSVVGELREIAKSETIIGEPVTVGDKTVIPIVKISVGFGAGGGQGEMEKDRAGFGGGGGGGAKIEPAAFIILDADGARL
ncbi:MAG: GerW family sporulation protein, partial [Candidatus Zixiibacteriota bacterium]